MADLLARDVLDYDDRLKMAALRILAESRKPVDVRGPGEIRIPVGAPPDNWLYNTLADPKLNAGLAQLGHNLVGSGTGSISGDILAGFLGGGAGIATEAAGGESGALDWIPGGGLLKAGVLAAPNATRILARVGQKLAVDDAVELTQMVAQSAVDRLARSANPVTKDDILRAVADEVDALGPFAASAQMKLEASKMAGDVLDNARRAMASGKPFSLHVKLPETLRYGQGALDEVQPYNKELAARNAVLRNRKVREFLLNLPQEEQDNIYRLAEEEATRAVGVAESAGNYAPYTSASEFKKNVKHNAVQRMAAERLREVEKIEKGADNVHKVNSNVADDESIAEEIRRAKREAYAAAKKQALDDGLSSDDATRIAHTAAARAQRVKEKEYGLTSKVSNSRGQRRNNARAVFDKLTPELKEEVERIANQARLARREELIKAGETAARAGSLSNSHYDTQKLSEVGKIVRNLGFKSVNDPRLANYERIGRNDTEHILKSGAGLSMTATPETVYGRALEEEAQELARISGEDYSFIYDILMGRNNGDEDAMALYDMLMGK